MTLRPLLLLALPFGLLLPGCDGGGDSGDPGLILAFSRFEGSRPLASEMAILRPGKGPLVPPPVQKGKKKVAAAEWSASFIQETEAPEKVALGTATDGSLVYGRLDDDGEPVGGPMRYARNGDRWELQPIEGMDESSVEWNLKSNGDLSTKDFEVAGGNVFHKAMWFDPEFGEPGILTISANMPMVKIWREGADGWTSELLFTAEVGSKEHRFRDIEIGDVDGDGSEELVMATHDRGKVFVLEQKADGLEAIEVSSREDTFVHEIEVGDVDGDGMAEIFSTPSEPNRMDGSHQTGLIERIDYEDGEWVARPVENSETTHAKEILLADIEQDGQLELYSAMEGEGLAGLDGQAEGGATTQIKRYDFDGETSTDRVVADLPSKMCRFLTIGDVEGDGQLEIFASTDKDGIFRVSLNDGEWESHSAVSALQSGGFEHSSVIFDIDGDGKDELFVADDKNSRVQMWYWDTGRNRLRRHELLDMSDKGFYITWGVMPLQR